MTRKPPIAAIPLTKVKKNPSVKAAMEERKTRTTELTVEEALKDILISDEEDEDEVPEGNDEEIHEEEAKDEPEEEEGQTVGNGCLGNIKCWSGRKGCRRGGKEGSRQENGGFIKKKEDCQSGEAERGDTGH